MRRRRCQPHNKSYSPTPPPPCRSLSSAATTAAARALAAAAAGVPSAARPEVNSAACSDKPSRCAARPNTVQASAYLSASVAAERPKSVSGRAPARRCASAADTAAHSRLANSSCLRNRRALAKDGSSKSGRVVLRTPFNVGKTYLPDESEVVAGTLQAQSRRTSSSRSACGRPLFRRERPQTAEVRVCPALAAQGCAQRLPTQPYAGQSAESRRRSNLEASNTTRAHVPFDRKREDKMASNV